MTKVRPGKFDLRNLYLALPEAVEEVSNLIHKTNNGRYSL